LVSTRPVIPTRSGAAFARLAEDYQDADKMRIEGSPSFVLNDGRQKLYGDVGFRIIEANIQELLQLPAGDQASWC
jgi:protein-disulfide isomerase